MGEHTDGKAIRNVLHTGQQFLALMDELNIETDNCIHPWKPNEWDPDYIIELEAPKLSFHFQKCREGYEDHVKAFTNYLDAVNKTKENPDEFKHPTVASPFDDADNAYGYLEDLSKAIKSRNGSYYEANGPKQNVIAGTDP